MFCSSLIVEESPIDTVTEDLNTIDFTMAVATPPTNKIISVFLGERIDGFGFFKHCTTYNNTDYI